MKKLIIMLSTLGGIQTVSASGYDIAEYERQIKAQTPARPSNAGTNSKTHTQGMGIKGVSPTPADGIEPGRGYSSDTEAIAPTTCYKPISVSRGAQTSQINFTTSQEISQIAKQFNVSTSFSAGNGVFGLSGMMSYLNEVSENDYSMSFNYSEKVAQAVYMQYGYNPQTSLNATGQAIYNNGTNPMFRLFCGDTLITSYEEGAGLILSMQVNFSDSTSKQTFKSAVSGSVFGFGSAAAQIQNIATAYHLKGNIVVQAYQIGGHPEDLSKIFQNSSYIFKCDITNTSACQNAAQIILNYASSNFPDQFSKPNGIWASNLVPTGGFGLDFRVSDFGMILSPSYVTPDILSKRTTLVEIYKKNKNYANYFQTIDTYYPATLETYIKSQVQTNNSLAKANVDLLEQAPGYGSSIDCWKFPFRCSSLYPELIGQVKPINFDASSLAYCEDPNLHFNVSTVCGSNAENRQYYSGNYFTPSKAPTVVSTSGKSGFNNKTQKICYATARYTANGWHNCAGPQEYTPNTSFQLSDFMNGSRNVM